MNIEFEKMVDRSIEERKLLKDVIADSNIILENDVDDLAVAILDSYSEYDCGRNYSQQNVLIKELSTNRLYRMVLRNEDFDFSVDIDSLEDDWTTDDTHDALDMFFENENLDNEDSWYADVNPVIKSFDNKTPNELINTDIQSKVLCDYGKEDRYKVINAGLLYDNKVLWLQYNDNTVHFYTCYNELNIDTDINADELLSLKKTDRPDNFVDYLENNNNLDYRKLSNVLNDDILGLDYEEIRDMLDKYNLDCLGSNMKEIANNVYSIYFEDDNMVTDVEMVSTEYDTYYFFKEK